MAGVSAHGRLRRLSELLEHEDEVSESEVDVCISGEVSIGTVENVEGIEEETIDTSVCVECQDEQSTHYCEQCNDHFCTLCFEGQHRKGRRKLHTFQPVLRQQNQVIEKKTF